MTDGRENPLEDCKVARVVGLKLVVLVAVVIWPLTSPTAAGCSACGASIVVVWWSCKFGVVRSCTCGVMYLMFRTCSCIPGGVMSGVMQSRIV